MKLKSRMRFDKITNLVLLNCFVKSMEIKFENFRQLHNTIEEMRN